MTIEETYQEALNRKARGQKGKAVEAKVGSILASIKAETVLFDYDRLPDTRSAGKIMPAQVSDFLLFWHTSGVAKSATLEAKEMRFKKGHKPNLLLNIKSGFPQYPRMLRRAKAGCPGFLLVFNETLGAGVWALCDVSDLPRGVKSLNIPKLINEGVFKTGTPKELILGILEC